MNMLVKCLICTLILNKELIELFIMIDGFDINRLDPMKISGFHYA